MVLIYVLVRHVHFMRWTFLAKFPAQPTYPPVISHSYGKIAIVFDDLPLEIGDFPVCYATNYQRVGQLATETQEICIQTP